MCALRKAAMCLCTWQLFLAQAEQLPGALLHHAARPACLLGTRVTTTIPPNCPGTNTLPRALIADIALPIGCESAQTARNPREADSSNAFDSDLGSWTVAHAQGGCVCDCPGRSISCRAARELPFPRSSTRDGNPGTPFFRYSTLVNHLTNCMTFYILQLYSRI